MIRLQNVSLNYDGGPNILDNIDLTLDEGSFHFLTGPSGAGKTSLLKLIFWRTGRVSANSTCSGRM